MKKLFIYLYLIIVFTTKIVFSQTFKVVVATFQDRTGMIVKKEAEASGNVTVGAVVGQKAGVGTASGQYAASTLESGKGDLGSQAADIFTSELVKTGKFRVLDRFMFERLLDSANYAGDMIAAAKSMGAHYLLTGTVTQAGISEAGGQVLGIGGKSLKGQAVVSVTLTNISTGEIQLADNAEGTQTEGGVVLLGSQVGAKKDLGLLLSSALHKAVLNLVPKISEAAGDLTNYPIECEIAGSGEKIYLNKGYEDGIQIGDEFEIIGIGKTLKIGGKIIQEKLRKGIIKVIEVFNDYAVANKTTFEVNDGDIGIKLVKQK